MHDRPVVGRVRFHPVRVAPDQEAGESTMTLVGLHDLLLGRRLGRKFQRRADIDHDRIDNELVVADVDADRTFGIAGGDDRLDRLLDREFDSIGNVTPRTPYAGVTLDETGNPRYV